MQVTRYTSVTQQCYSSISMGGLAKEAGILLASMRTDAEAETPVLWPPHVKS